jgi:TM2 domain-containing membrane protein YozV
MKDVDMLPVKNLVTSYILCLFLGILGAHQFYLRRPLLGVLYFFTGGIILCGWIYDIFTLPRQVESYNARIDDFYDAHDQEIEELEDEIEVLNTLLEKQLKEQFEEQVEEQVGEQVGERSSSQAINEMEAKIKELEKQLANSRNQSAANDQ